ncbi:MAG: hypothetical protein SynsKO_00940 [Synoicihabitans sp.]
MLVGNSLGAHVGIECLPHLTNVRGIILSCCAPVRRPLNLEQVFNPVPGAGAFFESEVDRTLLTDLILRYVSNSELVDSIVNAFEETDPESRSGLKADIIEGRFSDEVQVLTGFLGQKLLIAPSDEPLINMDYVRSLACGLQIQRLPNCRHYPHMERPEEFAELIAKFADKSFSE